MNKWEVIKTIVCTLGLALGFWFCYIVSHIKKTGYYRD